MRRYKNIFIVLLFFIVNSTVFAQKAELIREFGLNDSLLKVFGKNYKCFDSIFAGETLDDYSSTVFIDNEEIGIHIYDENVYIFFYNYLNDSWRHPIILNPGEEYKDIFVEILQKEYCIFGAYNSKEKKYFKLSFSNGIYKSITKDERDNEWKIFHQRQKRISFYEIVDEEMEANKYDIRFSGNVTKCALGKKEKLGRLYDYADLDTGMQLLKTSDGKDFLWYNDIDPTCNSDCTKVLCISNISYDIYKFFEDDYTIYIYDIKY